MAYWLKIRVCCVAMAETAAGKRTNPDDGKEAKKQATEMEKMMMQMEAMMKKQHESLEQRLTVKMDNVLGTKHQEQDKKIDAVRNEIVTVGRTTENLNAHILKVEWLTLAWVRRSRLCGSSTRTTQRRSRGSTKTSQRSRKRSMTSSKARSQSPTRRRYGASPCPS